MSIWSCHSIHHCYTTLNLFKTLARHRRINATICNVQVFRLHDYFETIKENREGSQHPSCIFNGSTICLFNRINSQTVRTKYLCVQDGQLAARAAQWSAFTIRVLRRAEEAGADGTPPMTAKTLLSSSIPGADRTVTYGSEVELVDFVTGVSSGP
ncbi:hypothetical protein H4Q26_002779 [Puccinia striiformis f. sp. tritici PST-130]|nr:hypothetical protein H4Q26_002779 [Puccinia striiformis f. sp. tritici PST-130]